ncbi:MAG: hypothetical protein RMM28_03775 [Thermoleophilia bacterium]|nr:hypothetical protein [Gaiellaceae bacterium]MDW8338238.1 hypothetical protein [Thermoleophilia bacterium]
MRALALCACALLVLAAGSSARVRTEPSAGTLSIERGRGLVVLEIRGAVLGRLASGTIRVVDITPRDRFQAHVLGRRLVEEPLGPRSVLYRGQGMRFRMIGGGYRISIRGEGLSLSAVGRGTVTLVGERRTSTEDAGVFSLEVDCSEALELCLPLPTEPERYVLGPRQNEGDSGRTR